MTDHIKIIAEMRAGELLTALEDAVKGNPHWRMKASGLLRSIARYELPEPATEALREVEIMSDLCDG
jgi:hypothetical protein